MTWGLIGVGAFGMKTVGARGATMSIYKEEMNSRKEELARVQN